MKFDYKAVDVNKTFALGDKGETIAKEYLIERLMKSQGFKKDDLFVVEAPKRYFPEWDFEITHTPSGLSATYEVKYDAVADKYGNLYIETNNGGGKPTGIYTSKAKWFVSVVPVGDKHLIMFFDRVELLARIELSDEPLKRKVNKASGNGYAEGALLPFRELLTDKTKARQAGLRTHDII